VGKTATVLNFLIPYFLKLQEKKPTSAAEDITE
jgi:hypothetical protein